MSAGAGNTHPGKNKDPHVGFTKGQSESDTWPRQALTRKIAVTRLLRTRRTILPLLPDGTTNC